MLNAVIEAHFWCFREFLLDWSILLRWDRRIMSFDDDSSHFEARQIVERNRNNLIDSRSSHRDEIASFLKSHFHDVNEIKKKLNWLNIDSCFIEFFLNLFNFFNWLTLIRVFIHYFDWSFNLLLLCFFKVFWNSRSRVSVSDLQNVSFLLLVDVELSRFFRRFQWFRMI